MFFPRLRRHAKWMFVLLALVFGLGFVLFGVGAGGVGVGDVFRDAGGGRGQSVSDAREETEEQPEGPRGLASSSRPRCRRRARRPRRSRRSSRRSRSARRTPTRTAQLAEPPPDARDEAAAGRRSSRSTRPPTARPRRRSSSSPRRPARRSSRTRSALGDQLAGEPACDDRLPGRADAGDARGRRVRAAREAAAGGPERPARARAGRAADRRRGDRDRRLRAVPEARAGRPERGDRPPAAEAAPRDRRRRRSVRLVARETRVSPPPGRDALVVAAPWPSPRSAWPRAATRSATRRATATASAARSSSSRAAARATRSPTPGRPGTIGPEPRLRVRPVAHRRPRRGARILQVVRGQIAYPVVDPSTDAPGMPADIFEGQDAEDVATYVASVAGLDANGEPIDPANPPKPAPPEGGDADGKAIFASAGCGGCHTLAAAGVDRHRRPEPRRGEAVARPRGRPRHERPGRHALVQGPAERRADPGGREVRRGQRRQVGGAAVALIVRRDRLEIDDDVRHRHVVAHAGVLDDALLEPVRAARRVSRDDDLVRRELAERVLERLQRIAVPDLAARLHAELRRAASRLASSRACARPRARRPRPTSTSAASS